MLKEILHANGATLGRREFLVGAGVAGSSLLASSCAVQSASLAPPSAASLALKAPIDFSSPDANLLGLVRVLGDVSGKPVFGWSHGQVFGVQEGELSKLLFDYVSCQRREFKQLEDGSWAKGYRGLILFTDPKTGKVIDTFVNPFTNEENSIRHFKTAFGAAVYTTTGPRSLRDFESETPHDYEKGYVLPWMVIGDEAWMTYDERVAYRRPDGAWRVDNAVYRYKTYISDLTNPAITAPRAEMMWSTELNWFTYMNMGDIPGHIMWAGMGRKYFDLSDVPASFVDEAEARYPGFLSEPVDWAEYGL